MKRETARLALRCLLAAGIFVFTFVSTVQGATRFKVLHYFLNHPASHPEAALVADSAGNLYGTASSSSVFCGCGTVFKLAREGGKWKYSTLYIFHRRIGEDPSGSLVFDSAGNLYGTTERGGAYGKGTVFELSASADKWTETVLHSFGGTSDDVSAPLGAVTFDASGNLYGTASFGGTSFSQGGIFELKRSGNKWTETVIYNFSGFDDGGDPMGDLIWDSAGNLYGTANDGGSSYDRGAVFELTPSGNGNWTETVLYRFAGSNDGGNPTSGLIFDKAGNLFGTASSSDAFGTVFELSPSMGGWTFKTLHDFRNEDGATPLGGLAFDPSGNIYGTTQEGGAYGNGVIFRLSQSGNGWTETVLRSFGYTEAFEPSAGLIRSHGVFYGTTSFDGIRGNGALFALQP